ncbi:MAG: DNA-directed RNA polymerase [Desulfurococcales archaeon]|nr:DNA-directed RNA polymerase [Desulfurococcales archaeon]
MYIIYEFDEWVDVPAKALAAAKKPEDVILEILRERLEGTGNPEYGIFIALIGVRILGDGIFLPEDPNIYLPVRYEVLAFKPELKELVKGRVREAREHGIFVGLGPIDGFVHRDQIMDERVEFDSARRGFRGIETGRTVEIGDMVIARIAQIGKGGAYRIYRIGMTMRQPYLGKVEWVKEAGKVGEEEPV